MATPNGRAKQFADWETRPAKDYDPEADAPDDSESGDGSEDSADEKAATEHYVDVGKSKLRRKDPVALGPRYRGARVSRADLEAQGEEEEEEEEEEAQEESDGGSSDHFEGAHEDLDGVYDDPDEADLEADQDREDGEDAEIDSDDALGESDEEKFKKFTFRGSSQALPHRGTQQRVTRPTAADFMGSDEEDEIDSEEDEDEGDEEQEGSDEDLSSETDLRNGSASAFLDDEAEEDDDDEDDDSAELDGFINDGYEDEDEDEDEEDEDEGEDSEYDKKKNKKGQKKVNGDSNRASLLDMVQAGQRSVAESLSSAAQKDVAKGKAVKQQQKAFDALLNVRIRLQKSLVAVNSLDTVGEADETLSEPYEAAEAAALKLWNSIEGYRSTIQSGAAGKSGQKRKRTADATMSSQDIWDGMEDTERRAKSRRKAVLENWSQKARNIRAVDKSARKFSGSVEKPLTVRLDEELQHAPERLIRRTRTPRSCAPVQVARKINEDPSIYDDADFYQLLLKELVDQRSADTSVGGAGASAATIRFTAVKEAKAKRHVDTKASKGRKMRFNVHEKLQNFMAPEDRRAWEESAVDRLFGTLFGQKMVLDEEEEDASADEEMGGVSVEEEGLRLF